MKPRTVKSLVAATVTTLVLATAGLASTATASPHEGGRQGGPRAEGMMLMGRGMDRMLEKIGASQAQRDQIRAISEAARADLKAQRESGRALHEQARVLWTQPTVDANAVEALRQQMLAQHDRASQRMMQAMLEASRVLSVEQRQQIAELMQQRHEKMRQRHDEQGQRHKR